MEASGTAFQAGVDTTQYAQMESTLSAAAARLDEMRAGTQQSESLMSRLASSARNVASFIGRAAKSAAGALASGIKAAASGMAKNAVPQQEDEQPVWRADFRREEICTQFAWRARRLGAAAESGQRLYGRKSAALNTLSACWSGIGNLLGPIITRIINLVAQAVAYVTAFSSSLASMEKLHPKKSAAQAGRHPKLPISSNGSWPRSMN